MRNSSGREISFLENVLYGVFMGIFEVVPGISGGTLAFILGIYEMLIGAVSNIRKDFKNSFKVLSSSLIGMGMGVYFFSFVIKFLNEKYPIEVSFCLTGLIVGIIPSILRAARNCEDGSEIFGDNIYNKVPSFMSAFSFLVTLGVMMGVNYISFKFGDAGEIIKNLDVAVFLRLMLVGMLSAFCLMLPGCSGSLIMLVFGVYFSVIEAIHRFNIPILVPVGLGVVLGGLLGSKIIYFCLKRYKKQTFYAILGLIVGSSVSPFLNVLNILFGNVSGNYLLFHGFVSIFTLAFGCVFSMFFSSNSYRNAE